MKTRNTDGTASWLGGAQKGDMEQVECFMLNVDIASETMKNYGRILDR